MSKRSDGPFHVVRHRKFDKKGLPTDQKWCIYANNAPFMVPEKPMRLTMREAYWIADTLNEKLNGYVAKIPKDDLQAGQTGLRKCD